MEEEDIFEQYDEFGNYIGEDIIDQAPEPLYEESVQEKMTELIQEVTEESAVEMDPIVLYEDKKYYPEMEEVFPGAETMIEEEDTMAITEPIIKDVEIKKFELNERSLPKLTFEKQFMLDLMKSGEDIRNIAFVGHLHHGKTKLLDVVVEQSLDRSWVGGRHNGYTDNRNDERERKISVKATPVSFVLQDSKEKSYLFNMMDTPGHTNFVDEACCGLRMADGAVVVVDVVEGMMVGTEKIIEYIVQEQIPMVLVVNKMDRLIIEMKIPPADAYLKIKHTIEEVNGVLKKVSDALPISPKRDYHLSPLKNNVIFASGEHSFIFSLESFATQYAQKYPKLDPKKFTKMLWGNYYFNRATKKVTRKPAKGAPYRAFVDFILQPLYKIVSYSISYEKEELEPVLKSLGVYLKKEDFRQNSNDILKRVCQLFFGDCRALVDMVVRHLPSPKQGTAKLVDQTYTGDKTTDFYKDMRLCDPSKALVINVLKLYNKENRETFDALGRVISGTIRRGQTLKVMGEDYSLDDPEDMTVKPVSNLYIFETRFKIPIQEAYAGNWVLIEGVDQGILKSATLVDFEDENPYSIFRPVKFSTIAFFKMALEPYIPSELPKMLEGLRKASKSYPLLQTKVEESGEHLIVGTGEIYLDSVLHDLRKMYSEIEIKVSDPCVSFCETVIDSSSIKCIAQTPNKQNKLTMIAQPLDKGLAEQIELEHLDLRWGQERTQKIFREKYEWDILEAQSVWAFGPGDFGPNIFQDDTLPMDTSKEILGTIKEHIVHGFQWCTQEGPLCEEPIRNVKFKLIGAEISEEPLYRASGQLIPTTRRCCYSSFLMANPRILEPTLLAEIQCTGDALAAVYNVLSRRRGHLIEENAKPGSPLFIVKANIPALDSFGFETDLRCHTTGQAFNSSVFDSWTILAGDPLDNSIQLKILEPSTPMELPREILVKMRRRKGLNEEVSILKYFDDPSIIETIKNDTNYRKLVI